MSNTQDATQDAPATGLLSRHSSMLIVGVLLGIVLGGIVRGVFTATIDDRLHVVTGIGGKGMTTGPALARESIEAL